MTELKQFNEQYECPVCASDIEPEYLSMCESEVNKIKAEAVREAIDYYRKESWMTYSHRAVKQFNEYANKLEQGE